MYKHQISKSECLYSSSLIRKYLFAFYSKQEISTAMDWSRGAAL